MDIRTSLEPRGPSKILKNSRKPRKTRNFDNLGMGAGGQGLPLPPGMSQKKSQVPRKPGVFPPFALFSQEQRPQILQDQPSISFGKLTPV